MYFIVDIFYGTKESVVSFLDSKRPEFLSFTRHNLKEFIKRLFYVFSQAHIVLTSDSKTVLIKNKTKKLQDRRW
jgi:hypothetical protein